MFNLRGDLNWRQNISGSPQLLLPVGLLFLLGIWVALRGSGRETGLKNRLLNSYSFPLWWIAIMLLPEELTAEGIPHALRSIGVLPGVGKHFNALPAQTIIFETLGHPPVTYLLPRDAQTYSPKGADIQVVQ